MEEGSIDDHVTGAGRNKLLDPCHDRRMSNALQALPSGRIREDNAAEGSPVDPALHRAHARTELSNDLLGSIHEHLMGDGVSVDDAVPPRRKRPSRHVLPRAVPSGQTDDHGACRL